MPPALPTLRRVILQAAAPEDQSTCGCRIGALRDDSFARQCAPEETHDGFGMSWVGQSIERVEDAALLTGRGRYIDDLGVPPGTLACRGAALAASACGHPRDRRERGARREGRRGGDHGGGRDRARRAAARRREGEHPVLADRGRARALCRRAGRGGGGGGPLSRRGRAGADRGRLRAAADHACGRPMRSSPTAPCCTTGSARTSRATARSATAIRRPRSRPPRIACRSRSTIRATPARRSRPTGWSPTTIRARTPTTCSPTFQGPFSIHAVLARALKVPGNRLRLRMPPDSGGSFGVKQGIFPYIALMGIAARVAGRPVKWIEDRLEHLTASVSATNRLITLEAAVEADGRVTRAGVGPGRGRRRAHPRARAGHALPHARQSHRRLRHPQRRRCATAW